MRIKKEIEQEVQKTFDSLEGMQSATPGPFFFTRVKSRLERADMNIWERITAFIVRPAVAIAVIFLVVLMNAIAIVQQDQTPSYISEQPEQLYEEFSLADNAVYDYENLEP